MKKHLFALLFSLIAYTGFSQPWSLSQLQNTWHTRYLPSVTDLDSTWSCLWNKTTDGNPQLASAIQSLYTTSVTSITTNSTVANYPGLVTNTLTSGSVYIFEAVISYSCAATGGARIKLTGSSIPTFIQYTIIKEQNSSSTISTTFKSIDGVATYVGGSTVGAFIIKGLVKVGTAGTLLLQVAEGEDIGTLDLYSGNYFTVRKL